MVPYVLAKQSTDQFNFDLTEDYGRKAMPDFLRVTPQDGPSARVLFFDVPKRKRTLLRRSSVLDIPVDVEATEVSGTLVPGAMVRFLLALD